MTPIQLNELYQQNQSVQAIIQYIEQCLQGPQRILIGLTGGPGSGKSSLATYLAEHFAHQENALAALSMDGFHLTKAQLAERPDAEHAIARRGAPWTFDSQGFVSAVKNIRESYQTHDLKWPSFDHQQGDPVQDALSIGKQTKVVLIEGLYLLHQDDGWQEAAALFDQHWFLDVPLELAIERLAKRHMQAWGFSHQQAMDRINASDGLNARLVESYKGKADRLISL